jgi:hypothetical protein
MPLQGQKGHVGVDIESHEAGLRTKLEREQNLARRQELLKDLWRLARQSSAASSDVEGKDGGHEHE